MYVCVADAYRFTLLNLTLSSLKVSELLADTQLSTWFTTTLLTNFSKIHPKSRALIQRYPTPKKDLVKGQHTTSEALYTSDK